MKKLFNRLKAIKRTSVIKNSFLIPILLVVFMSISHVVSWYDIGNPVSWAIYLSVAVEIFALASVSAASINVSRFSVWALFGLVTSIQIIGNIFFTYQDIDVAGSTFLSWVELVKPWFEDWDVIDHRRFLALIQGGTLPMMSLIALHYYIKFNDKEKAEKEPKVIEVAASTFPPEVMEHIKNDTSTQNAEETTSEETNVEETMTDLTEEVKPIEETTEEKPEVDNNVIVEDVKQINTERAKTKPSQSNDTGQWAGRHNKNNDDQNPQIMPGVN